jgi:hypothetical protein
VLIEMLEDRFDGFFSERFVCEGLEPTIFGL